MSATGSSPSVGVIAWGTALAQMLASDGRDVLLWAREEALVEEINSARTNSVYLPSAQFAPTIRATSDLAEMAYLDVALVVTPAQHMGSVLEAMPSHPNDLVLCSKGIEASTGRLMNHVARDAAPGSAIAVLSGPTFAHEVAEGLPTAVTLACGGGEDQWPFAPISRTMSRARKSAVRSRTCSPSPAAWWTGSTSARTPAPP